MAETARTYAVEGMTCDHCARAVHDEVARLEGADSVAVELGAGRLTVVGPAEPAEVEAAVSEAGYAVAR